MTHLRLPLPGKEVEAAGVCPAWHGTQPPPCEQRKGPELSGGEGLPGLPSAFSTWEQPWAPAAGDSAVCTGAQPVPAAGPAGQEAHSAPACLLAPALPGRKQGQLCQVSEELGTGLGRGQSPGQAATREHR